MEGKGKPSYKTNASGIPNRTGKSRCPFQLIGLGGMNFEFFPTICQISSRIFSRKDWSFSSMNAAHLIDIYLILFTCIFVFLFFFVICLLFLFWLRCFSPYGLHNQNLHSAMQEPPPIAQQLWSQLPLEEF